MDLKKLSLCGACACALLSLPALARAADGDDEGPVTAELGGRLHWDFAQFDNDDRGTPNPDDTEIRRLWLDVSGKFFGFGYKVEGDFAGLQDDFNSKGIEAKDVYLTRKFDAGTLSIGQFKQYFSLDDRTGSNFGQFLERSGAGSTLAPLYRKAVSWQAAGKDYTWAASAYSLESIDVSNIKGDAFGGRGTWAPGARDGDVLHLGLSLAHERYDHPGANGAPALSIRPRAAGHLSDDSRITLARFADGRDTDVDKWSLEYAQVRGPLSWQSEFSGGLFDDGAQRAQVMSAYGFVSWFATGESRRYDGKTGRFTRIKQVDNPRGAFELALRYDRMWGTQHLYGQADFLDASTESWTLAGNWYLKPNLRLMLNLIDSRNRDRLAGATVDHTRAITGRFQYDF